MTKATHSLEIYDSSRFRKSAYSLIWTIFGLFILFSGFGCSHDHKINLNPEVFVRVSNIGKSERLVVRVNDIRPQKAISKKKSDLKVTSDRSINTVTIYASSNVSDTVSEKIMEGFERMGFHPSKHGGNSSRTIIVEITKLHLNYQQGKIGIKIPEIHAVMETTLRVRARRGAQSFKNIYSTRMTRSNRILTGKFKNERLINNGLSIAIQKMFDDPELLQFLAPTTP